MTMTTTHRPDLVAAVIKATDMTNAEAQRAVTAVLASIVKLAEEGRLTLHEFGRFEMKTRKARLVANSLRGGPVEVPERRALTFKPSPALVLR